MKSTAAKQQAVRALEQNVVGRFSVALHKRFPQHLERDLLQNFADTTLGAQDQSFADYLLAANARFALIEFKASFLDIRSEVAKPLRKALFKHMVRHDDTLRRCLDFHFVCWGVTTPVNLSGVSALRETELINHYAIQVAPFMPVGPDVAPVEDFSTAAFLDDFLGARLLGGTAERFKVYLNELAALAGGRQGDASTIEGMVFVFVPGDAREAGQYMSLRFRGIEELTLYLQMKSPQLEHTPREIEKLKPKGPTLGGVGF